MELILTHEHADFDAVAGLLAAAHLYPAAVPALPERVNSNVMRFLALYGQAFPIVKLADVRVRTVDHVIQVDSQRVLQMKGLRRDAPVTVIDHHPLARELPAHYAFDTSPVGAVTTVLVERIREQSRSVTSLEATLLMLGIYEDTGYLTYGVTTTRDMLAAAWLLEQGADLDVVRRFLSHPLNEEQQRLLERLTTAVETRTLHGTPVSVSAVVYDSYVPEISGVTNRLRDVLETTALFVLVGMPDVVQLVARSSSEEVDAAQVARALGGGGHSRAAAASIRNLTLEEAVERVWQALQGVVSPSLTVGDLMSYGAQTVAADQTVAQVGRRLRQIGHEGYPVVDQGHIVGLLTRRDLDRAEEHGLRQMRIREVMTAGQVTLTPQDSIYTLERLMADSGWGQIPVVDGKGHLIGIVTRTDLIKYWSRTHPAAPVQGRRLSTPQIEQVLGIPVARLIEAIAQEAEAQRLTLYMVGGVVRDILLGRANMDIDFVVEGDAAALGERLTNRWGGDLTTFRPFGTAKWLELGQAAEQLGVAPGTLPDHVDFASARYEFYEHPTALPTVYNSSIKLDLQRRDFTINTLAVQLSPLAEFGRVLDFYGGLRDLEAGVVRVLHSLSFIDDPTRILRAYRFARRLSFRLEARTEELVETARPMLGRITGERLRSELTLLLQERQPEAGLALLQEHGLLQAIHPGLNPGHDMADLFRQAREARLPWPLGEDRLVDLWWHLLAISLPLERLADVCERLLFGRRQSESLLQAAQLASRSAAWPNANMRPSLVVDQLRSCSELALLTGWIKSDDVGRHLIARYWAEWRHVHPELNGDDLRQMGLEPGPCYGVILARLHTARLDGLVDSRKGEESLVQRWLSDERLCESL